jgi:hypothetical protein
VFPLDAYQKGREPGQTVSAELIGLRKLAEWFKSMV